MTAAIFLIGAGSASASTVTINGSYTLSYSKTAGNGPKLTDVLKDPFKESLTLGGPAITPVNFFTAAPNSSSGISCGSRSNPCTSTNDIASGLITVKFTITDPFNSKVTEALSDTGLYQADYKGILPSGCTDPASKGQTDCIDWTGTPAKPGNSVTLSTTLSNGDLLDVILYNQEDWDITPKVSFEILPPTIGRNGGATPLPPALALFAGGLGVFGFFGRRRVKKVAGVPSN